MLTVSQLSKAIDTLKKINDGTTSKIIRETGIYLPFVNNLDSNWAVPKMKTARLTSFSQIVPDSAKQTLIDIALSQANSVKGILESNAVEYDERDNDLRLHMIEWHRKFSLSLTCLVLFLIGAPLGSIIRKGGIGTPLIFAVAFFVVLFLLNNFGEKFIKQNVVEPVVGMWMATVVLLPVGIFLVTKAMRDSQLFNKEYYYRFLRRIRNAAKQQKLKTNESGNV
jgi:lipopolysaccharide export system permease protein